MTKQVRMFISFDYEHDKELKNGLVGQLEQAGYAQHWIDQSIPYSAEGRWQTEAQRRISQSDLVLVICGKNTHSARGVDIEHKIARQLNKPVRLLRGRVEGSSPPPDVAATDAKMWSMNPGDVARLMAEFSPR